MPPSSVAVKDTTKGPSSSGVKVKEVPEPVANVAPLLVTFQPYVRPPASPGHAVLAAPVNVSGEPSGISGGSLTMLATGATAMVCSVNVLVTVWLWLSEAKIEIVWSGPSSDAGCVQDQVPVPVLVTVPEEAVSVTGSPS